MSAHILDSTASWLAKTPLMRWLAARSVNWFDNLPTQEIMSRDGSRHYLTRRFIFGHRKSRWALMLHEMHIPDDDSCHHDHPWNFWTLILSGGYLEEVTILCPCGDMDCSNNDHGSCMVEERWNGPGRIRYNPATHTHRITELPEGKCWTLVLRTKKKRSWGFRTKLGWEYWKDFIEHRLRFGAIWCGDDR